MAFEELLGVPLFAWAGEHDGHEIETVVARHWWDDYALDFAEEDTPEGESDCTAK